VPQKKKERKKKKKKNYIKSKGLRGMVQVLEQQALSSVLSIAKDKKQKQKRKKRGRGNGRQEGCSGGKAQSPASGLPGQCSLHRTRKLLRKMNSLTGTTIPEPTSVAHLPRLHLEQSLCLFSLLEGLSLYPELLPIWMGQGSGYISQVGV
jgi:hypothetical protein